MERAGFELIELVDFNKVGVVGWALNGKLLKREHFSTIQLKLLNTAIPAFVSFDHLAPWHGLSLIAVARKLDR